MRDGANTLTGAAGGPVYIAFGSEAPSPDPAELDSLLATCHKQGIELHVSLAVLEQFLAKPQHLSRTLLAEVWKSAIESHPQAIGLSLSHTHGLAVAVARAAHSGSAGVGVDIEWSHREVDPRILQRVAHPEDE